MSQDKQQTQKYREFVVHWPATEEDPDGTRTVNKLYNLLNAGETDRGGDTWIPMNTVLQCTYGEKGLCWKMLPVTHFWQRKDVTTSDVPSALNKRKEEIKEKEKEESTL